MKKEGASENFGLFSTILGIISIISPLVAFPISFFSGSIVGLILSIISLVFAFKSTSWRKPAFTLAIIGIVFNIIIMTWSILGILSFLNQLSQLQQSGALEQVLEVSQ